jgi:hydrogenase expression/formation protein HypC
MCLGIPGKLLEVYERDDLPMGKVEFGGIVKETCLAYMPQAQVGDYLLVHVGFAISQIDQHEAEEIFSYVNQIAEAAELEQHQTDCPTEAGKQPQPRPPQEDPP